ncbi:Uncharacterised protein [Enterobacter cloacae]|nr:Uncharacterised protein [Enterobacter cloacae]
MRQLLVIVKYQFGMIMGFRVFDKIIIAADHAAIFHINEEVIPLADITHHVLSRTLNFNHARR